MKNGSRSLVHQGAGVEALPRGHPPESRVPPSREGKDRQSHEGHKKDETKDIPGMAVRALRSKFRNSKVQYKVTS